MPTLTRRDFLDASQGVFDQALAAFQRSGTVYETVYAFDARCRITSILGLSGADVLSPPKGTVVLPSPLRSSAVQIKDLFAERRVVAAVHAAEAWVAMSVGATVQEALESLGDRPASEHPSRQEAITVTGLWPREFAVSTHLALIRRLDETRPVVEVLPEPPEQDLMLAASWLSDCLPQPPRAHTAN